MDGKSVDIKRFIFTGTPGSGQSSVIKELEKLGYSVIHEAATDVISIEQAKGIEKPWDELCFVDQITHMQKERQMNANRHCEERSDVAIQKNEKNLIASPSVRNDTIFQIKLDKWIFETSSESLLNIVAERWRKNSFGSFKNNNWYDMQFYDRSPFCTYALAKYLSHHKNVEFKPSPVLLDEIDRCLKDGIYQNKVFFFENLGFIEHTDARKISYEDALIFEQIHFDMYKQFSFDIMMVAKGLTVKQRCEFILERAL